MTHGAYGFNVYHVAVHIGKGRVVEFNPKRGVVKGAVDDIIRRCRLDHEKCPDPETTLPRVRVYRCTVPHRLPQRSISSFPFPNMTTLDERVEWAIAHIRPHDYRLSRMNCEHVARWISCGSAYSWQMQHVHVMPNHLVDAFVSPVYTPLVAVGVAVVFGFIVVKRAGMAIKK